MSRGDGPVVGDGELIAEYIAETTRRPRSSGVRINRVDRANLG
jgi:hypothetical protein